MRWRALVGRGGVGGGDGDGDGDGGGARRRWARRTGSRAVSGGCRVVLVWWRRTSKADGAGAQHAQDRTRQDCEGVAERPCARAPAQPNHVTCRLPCQPDDSSPLLSAPLLPTALLARPARPACTASHGPVTASAGAAIHPSQASRRLRLVKVRGGSSAAAWACRFRSSQFLSRTYLAGRLPWRTLHHQYAPFDARNACCLFVCLFGRGGAFTGPAHKGTLGGAPHLPAQGQTRYPKLPTHGYTTQRKTPNKTHATGKETGQRPGPGGRAPAPP